MDDHVLKLLDNVGEEPVQIILFTVTQQVTSSNALYRLVEKVSQASYVTGSGGHCFLAFASIC